MKGFINLVIKLLLTPAIDIQPSKGVSITGLGLVILAGILIVACLKAPAILGDGVVITAAVGTGRKVFNAIIESRKQLHLSPSPENAPRTARNTKRDAM